MSHEVETMFYTKREAPWHGLGVAVEDCLSSEEALFKAVLNWQVNKNPIYDQNGNKINGYAANTRDSDNSILGIVSDRYKIVQNTDAFAFTDALLDFNAKYETAGSLRGGRTIWLLAKLPDYKILGDDVTNYLVFCNTHDGTGAVKVACVPTRVVCMNTLNLALNSAKRMWSAKHTGSITTKLNEARHTLELAYDYMDGLSETADVLANSKISTDEIMKILAEIFPLDEDASDRQKNTVAKVKDEIMYCYVQPDIARFLGTKYGFINAVADWCDHAEPQRNTADYQANNWGRIMNGHPVLDKAYELVTAK